MITLLAILSLLLIYSAYKRCVSTVGLRELNEFSLQNTLPLRGFLALLIILGHYAQAYARIPYLGTFEYIGGPVVGCFFFLSGYGLAVSYARKGDAYIRNFLSKRLWRLLPVFLFMTLAAMLVKVYFLGVTWSQLMKDIQTGFPPLDTSWFVYALILFYIAFYVLARMSRSLTATAWLLLGFTFVYMVAMRLLHFGGWWYSSILSLPLGYFAAIYTKQIHALVTRHLVVVVLMVLLLLWGSWWLADWRRELFQPALTLMVPIAVYLLIAIMPSVRHLSIPATLGKVSYEIYLSQGFFMMFLSYCTPVPGALVVFVGSVVLAYILNTCDSVSQRVAR